MQQFATQGSGDLSKSVSWGLLHSPASNPPPINLIQGGHYGTSAFYPYPHASTIQPLVHSPTDRTWPDLKRLHPLPTTQYAPVAPMTLHPVPIVPATCQLSRSSVGTRRPLTQHPIALHLASSCQSSCN